MAKKVVVRKRTEPVKKKVVVKKKEKKRAPSPLPLRITSKFHLRCYHGTPPPWLTIEQRKNWTTGTWFVIESKKDHYASGTEKAGYETQEAARLALQEL